MKETKESPFLTVPISRKILKDAGDLALRIDIELIGSNSSEPELSAGAATGGAATSAAGAGVSAAGFVATAVFLVVFLLVVFFFFACASTAVSYTHLDVYKRQVRIPSFLQQI